MTAAPTLPVHVPTPLRSYTAQAAHVEATGATVGALLDDLERRYPGIRFRMIDEQERIRQHIRLFVNEECATTLDTAVRAGDTLTIICAISGGCGRS